MSEIWLSQEEVSALENIKKRAFWKRFKQNHYKTFRYVKSENGGRGGQRLEIALSSISADGRARYYKERNGAGEKLHEISDAQFDDFDRQPQ